MMQEYHISDHLSVKEGHGGDIVVNCLIPDKNIMDDEPGRIQREEDMKAFSAVITNADLKDLAGRFQSEGSFDWKSEDGKLTLHATPGNLNLVFPLKDYPYSTNRAITGDESKVLADILVKMGRENRESQ